MCALAAYAFECPEAPFPEIADGGPLFVAEGIGHPLLPAARCVRNDLRLDAERRCLIVSGSNMSGKSTLLRAVGVNAVLAFAGAPVCARRLSLSPLALGAAIRIHDSLQGGSSRFHAEVTRIAELLRTAAGRAPLLFLLDEILHGTNSHDRRIGAAAIVHRLLERGAIGLVTTHDLALAAIADDGGGGTVSNVHFVDRVEDGRMVFDYRMRPGVVRRSNALDVMRALGIDV
jgi:DNA mismatch repair ATPase MutS